MSTSDSRTRTFTVDAKLLQELGERLVGRPYIALAELIKNSFDADAKNVEIKFDGDSISVIDDGHGMSEETFTERWMRIGTAEKAEQRVSPRFERPLTGSKGVGRLAAQLLARELELTSTALVDPSSEAKQPRLTPSIRARVNWPEALKKKDLTSVTVQFASDLGEQLFVDDSRHGTAIVMRGLANTWGADEFESLAREVWALQPPFAPPADDASSFRIRLTTPRADIQRSFDDQMTALFDIADATIQGRLLPLGSPRPPKAEVLTLPKPRVAIDEQGEIPADDDLVEQFEEDARGPSRDALITVDATGTRKQTYVLEIPNCQLEDFDFEIRVFDLIRRQPKGILVTVARQYLSSFGGVHIYDNGFRLPYYGPDVDWLRLELDHARRLSRSRLLPKDLQVENAMQDLPSNKRVFGAVNISTSKEIRAARRQGRSDRESLAIQITRDRLASNVAFDQLTRTVRLSLDLYAVARARSRFLRVLERPRPQRESLGQLEVATTAVEAVRTQIPSEAYETVRDALSSASRELTTRDRESKAYASLLGSLATAGITSLAYEHEISAQRGQIEDLARRVRAVARSVPEAEAEKLADVSRQLTRWAQRSERIRDLFRPLLDEEDRTSIGRFKARALLDDVVKTLVVLARATKVDTSGVPTDLVLPVATVTAWFAVFQNILVNGFRATVDSDEPLIKVDGGVTGSRAWMRFQDNGTGGVDLEGAERLFLPFERGSHLSDRAAALGLGGTGLGLTIVRMIADEMRVRVKFEAPDAHWSTAIRVSWGIDLD